MHTIGPYTCVVFDQRYEHAGAPYTDGRKVFLRTELVVEVSTVEHDPEIAALFSRACYRTGESVFAPELAVLPRGHASRSAGARSRRTRTEPLLSIPWPMASEWRSSPSASCCR